MPNDRVKFEVVTHSYLPPLIQTWQFGLERVDADKSRRPNCTIGYALPKPDLFVVVKTEGKLQLMIASWLRLRSGLLARFNTSDYSPHAFSHQTWRTILQIDWLGTTPTIQSPARGEQARRDQAATFLKGCQDELSIETSGSAQARWRDKESLSLGLDDIREILWELSEINFRLEFFALDQKLCGSESTRHLNLLGQCFPYGRWNMLHHVDLGSANYGIAHSNWIERAPYIFAMRRCMQGWRGCPASLSASSDQTGGYSEIDVERVEKEMAYFYVETFFVTFGREPVLPRRLTHTPNGYFVSEQRQRAQVARPGVYLDISSWEHE